MTAETVFTELDELKKKKNSTAAEQNLAAAKAALRGVITQTETELRQKKQKRTVAPAEQKPIRRGDEVQLLNVSDIAGDLLDRPGSGWQYPGAGGHHEYDRHKVSEVRLMRAPEKQKPKNSFRAGSGGVREGCGSRLRRVRSMCAACVPRRRFWRSTSSSPVR